MKRLVSILLIVGIITTLALVGLVACKDTRTGYPDGDKYTAGPGTYSANNVSKLNVAWTGGTANVTFTDEVTDIQIAEENNFTDEAYLLHHYLDPQGTLWIKPLAASVGDDQIPTFSTKILTVKLPIKALEEVYVENHGADINLVGANAQKLSTYNTGHGTRITESRAVELNATSQGLTGDVSFNGAVTGTVKISAAMQAFLTTTTMPTEITMSGKGIVSCNLPKEAPGFKVTYNKVTKFSSNIEGMSEAVEEEDSYYRTYGTAATQIKLSCATRTWILSDKTQNDTRINFIEPNVV